MQLALAYLLVCYVYVPQSVAAKVVVVCTPGINVSHVPVSLPFWIGTLCRNSFTPGVQIQSTESPFNPPYDFVRITAPRIRNASRIRYASDTHHRNLFFPSIRKFYL